MILKQWLRATRIPAKTGNIVKVFLSWRGKFYSIQMFFPSVKVPGRSEIQDQINKVYPGAKVQNYVVTDYEPGNPLLQTEGAAWTKKKESLSQVDSMKKAESLTKEKIQDLTSKHLARRLEIPVGHLSALE